MYKKGLKIRSRKSKMDRQHSGQKNKEEPKHNIEH